MALRWPQDVPKMVPRRLLDVLRWPKTDHEAPRGPQEGARRLPGAPQKAPTRLPESPRRPPEGSQEAFRRPLECPELTLQNAFHEYY